MPAELWNIRKMIPVVDGPGFSGTGNPFELPWVVDHMINYPFFLYTMPVHYGYAFFFG